MLNATLRFSVINLPQFLAFKILGWWGPSAGVKVGFVFTWRAAMNVTDDMTLIACIVCALKCFRIVDNTVKNSRFLSSLQRLILMNVEVVITVLERCNPWPHVANRHVSMLSL